MNLGSVLWGHYSFLVRGCTGTAGSLREDQGMNGLVTKTTNST